ncbi:MAG: SGNH/GDSL hydrolase family protein [Myxococcota bacterium]
MAKRRTLLRVLLPLLTLAGAELVLRTFTDPGFGQRRLELLSWMSEDPVLGSANVPGFEAGGIRINALGLRGPELRDLASRRPLRIVSLGDSGTFGIWLGEADSSQPLAALHFDGYPEALRTLVGERAEVINAGVAGYTSSHGLRQLVTKLLELEPDVVTVRFGVNDLKISRGPQRRVEEPPSPWLRSLLYASFELRLTRLGLTAYRRASFLHPRPGSLKAVDLARFRENLERFVELSRQEDFHLLFVEYVLRPLELGEHPHHEAIYRKGGLPSLEAFHREHQRYQAVVRELAVREGIPLVETRDALTSSSELGFSAPDFTHPNAYGAEQIARALERALVELGWLPRAPADVGHP